MHAPILIVQIRKQPGYPFGVDKLVAALLILAKVKSKWSGDEERNDYDDSLKDTEFELSLRVIEMVMAQHSPLGRKHPSDATKSIASQCICMI